MSVIKKFQEATKVLNELSTAAVSARSEVQKLLTVLLGSGSTITDVNVKYADADDVDDWPTPEQEAADIGTGTPNIWPNYSGSFTVQDFAFVGSTHLYNSDATPKSQYLVTSSSG